MEMNTELVCVMASLGYHDDSDYYLGEDCLPSLKDLIRFLRREDDSCNVRRQMGHAQLLQKVYLLFVAIESTSLFRKSKKPILNKMRRLLMV